MKKPILFIVTLCISLITFAQKIIENPTFSATTDANVQITKIELHDTITKIDFEVESIPKRWIQVSSDGTHIQNSDGGEKLYVTRAEGIKLNERHRTPESGINKYTLYFPAIDKNVAKIDFLEESWKIFDIDLKGEKTSPFIPEEIQGNWLRTDGSNQWEYGIYNDKVIYKNSVWDKVLINKKGKSYMLTLKNETAQENLIIKPKKEGLLIGGSPANMQLFSKTKTNKPTYKIENNAEYKLPVFKMDTAVYKGYIKGYHPKMGKTGMAYVNNILTHEQNSHLIQIEPNGSFSCKIPMIHPQEIFIRMLKVNERVYCEPGKTTFNYIDYSEYTALYKSNNERKKRERKSLFMGEVARINTDLLAMDSIDYFDYQQAQNQILDMSGEEFKSYCLDIMQKEQKALTEYVQTNNPSKKALQIKALQIPYDTYQNILSYNMMKSSAYRRKHKIPREQREIPLEPESFEPDYYSFMNNDELNNPLSLVSGGAYNTLINRVRFNENVRPKSNFIFIALKGSITQKNIPLNIEERNILDALIKSEGNLKEIFSSDSLAFKRFYEKHAEIMSSVSKNGYKKAQSENLITYFGIDKGFVNDIIFAQSKCERMRGEQKPFSEVDKDEIKANISNEFIVEHLLQYSDAEQKKIDDTLEANKHKTGYVINETPITTADKLFDTIMSKYKGKVVFVDFWATWCGPCRSGMEKIKPLKEELKDEAIEFVYITNHTSPIGTWNMMIPDIKGEHYRLNPDEWNHFASKFNISGIPHYVLVDKNGNVVKDKIYFASSNQELKKLFAEFLTD